MITLDNRSKSTILHIRDDSRRAVLPPPLSYQEAQRGYEAIITYPYNPKSWPYEPDGEILTHLSFDQVKSLTDLSYQISEMVYSPDLEGMSSNFIKSLH